MSFKKIYKKQQVPEWSDAYLTYDILNRILVPFREVNLLVPDKDLIMSNIKNTNIKIDIPDELKNRVFLLEEQFYHIFEDQINKISQFYEIQLSILKQQITELQNVEKDEHKKSLKLIYNRAKKLGQYIKLNIQAANKLISKYEEYTKFIDTTSSHLKEQIERQNFMTDKELKQIKEDIEVAYKETQWSIRDLKKSKSKSQPQIYLFGIYLGVVLFLIANIAYQRIDIQESNIQNDQLYFPMYMCIGWILIYFWFLSLTIYVWRKFYINYQAIFLLKNTIESEFAIMSKTAGYSIMYLFMLVLALQIEQNTYADQKQLMYHSPLGGLFFFKTALGPMIMWCLILAELFNPIKILDFKGRMQFLKIQIKTISGIFINNIILWNQEQWLSLSLFLKYFYFTIYFYVLYFSNDETDEESKIQIDYKNIGGFIFMIIPIIYSLYFSIRVGLYKNIDMRKKIHNINKNIFVLMIVIIGFITSSGYVYLMSVPIAIYVSYIDIKYEWNLLQPESTNKFLRDRLAYPIYYYYFSIFIDVILRTVWLYTLVHNLISFNLLYIFGALEMFRRFIHNVIFVESEHIIHIGEFKAVPDILLEQNDPLLLKQKSFFERIRAGQNIDNFIKQKAHSIQNMLDGLDKSNISTKMV
ncbi:hypothetical protein pb186bvf_004204 [Paramecium bursaria]